MTGPDRRGARGRTHRRAVVVLLIAVSVATAPLTIASPAAALPPTPFYEVPDPLPAGAPGELIKSEVAADANGIKTYRVMYHSRSLPGNDIAVTGLVHIPTAVAAPNGGRNVVTVAHGTTGTADDCAPSLSSGLNSRFRPWVDAGYVVVETDYEGLGTPGIHPHLVGESEARGTIDIVRAARHLPDAEAGTRYAASGVSQGGHAVLFVGEIAATWAPELQLVGVNSEAPGTEIPLAARVLSKLPDGQSAVGVFMTAIGMHEAYPQADLAQILTPLGLSMVHFADELCNDELAAELAAVGGGPALFQDIEPPEPWFSLLIAVDPGHRPTPVPVRIMQGGQDSIVLPFLTEALHDRLCSIGDTVTRDLYPSDGHGPTSDESRAATIQFVLDRFAGAPYASDCPAVPTTANPSTNPSPSATNSNLASPTARANPVVATPRFTG